MADEKKSGWAAVGEFFADLVKHPKQLFLAVVLVASFVGYDLSVPAGRLAEARKKLDETKQRLDEMEKVIGELKDAQVQTVKALNK